MKISKNWEFIFLPVTRLRRRDIDWNPENRDDSKKGYYSHVKTDKWIESCPQAYPVREIMFANCDKYHRCPNWPCGGRLNWEYEAMFQFCTECGTLVLPRKMRYFNPEEIIFFFKFRIPWKVRDFEQELFWKLSDHFGSDTVEKYYDPWERRRKIHERRLKKLNKK